MFLSEILQPSLPHICEAEEMYDNLMYGSLTEMIRSGVYERGDVIPDECLLTISQPNKKLSKSLNAPSFELVAGLYCPSAGVCFAQPVETGKKTEGGLPKTKIVKVPKAYKDNPEKWAEMQGINKDTHIQCYGASLQQRLPHIYAPAKHNGELIEMCKTSDEMAELINESIIAADEYIDGMKPSRAKYFRLHGLGGDFFSKNYFDAWVKVAEARKHTTFYTYSPNIMMLLSNEASIPDNLKVTLSQRTASAPLKKRIEEYAASTPAKKRKFKVAFLVNTEEEADVLGLEIDRDDTHAANPTVDFALLLHGRQPKGSKAGKDVFKNQRKKKNLEPVPLDQKETTSSKIKELIRKRMAEKIPLS